MVFGGAFTAGSLMLHGTRQRISRSWLTAIAVVMAAAFHAARAADPQNPDRKSTRLNSSHGYISYAVFCLKKKKNSKPTAPAHQAHQQTTATSPSLADRCTLPPSNTTTRASLPTPIPPPPLQRPRPFTSTP